MRTNTHFSTCNTECVTSQWSANAVVPHCTPYLLGIATVKNECMNEYVTILSFKETFSALLSAVVSVIPTLTFTGASTLPPAAADLTSTYSYRLIYRYRRYLSPSQQQQQRVWQHSSDCWIIGKCTFSKEVEFFGIHPNLLIGLLIENVADW